MRSKRKKTSLNRIKEVMAERELTQRGLASMAGLTQKSISLYVNGRREPPLESLYQIAKALNVKGSDLITF